MAMCRMLKYLHHNCFQAYMVILMTYLSNYVIFRVIAIYSFFLLHLHPDYLQLTLTMIKFYFFPTITQYNIYFLQCYVHFFLSCCFCFFDEDVTFLNLLVMLRLHPCPCWHQNQANDSFASIFLVSKVSWHYDLPLSSFEGLHPIWILSMCYRCIFQLVGTKSCFLCTPWIF